jgi:membrane-associated phospholipid phosphatase
MTLRREKLVVTALLPGIMPAAFFWMAAVTSAGAATAWPETDLDRWLPLWPGAVWLYASWYPAHLVLAWVRAGDFRRIYRAYAIGFAVCLACYAAFPASVHRPSPPGAGLSAWALGVLYRHDPPVNLFPSFHATVAAIIHGLRGRRRWVSRATSLWALGVCAACVLTKQHYVIDVVGGFALGTVALRLASVDVASPAPGTARRVDPAMRPAMEEIR